MEMAERGITEGGAESREEARRRWDETDGGSTAQHK